MKPSPAFKQVIQDYLVARAKNDSLFAAAYLKPNKNIDDCITYILNTVSKSGCNGFADDEIYNMAVHYYDEDTIQVGQPVNCHVVVNHAVELTVEEQQEAKQTAIQQLQQEAYTAKKKKPAKVKKESTNQLSLF